MSEHLEKTCENCSKTMLATEEFFKTAEIEGEKHYFCGIECKIRWLERNTDYVEY
jgi:YHS domain-containing protein